MDLTSSAPAQEQSATTKGAGPVTARLFGVALVRDHDNDDDDALFPFPVEGPPLTNRGDNMPTPDIASAAATVAPQSPRESLRTRLSEITFLDMLTLSDNANGHCCTLVIATGWVCVLLHSYKHSSFPGGGNIVTAGPLACVNQRRPAVERPLGGATALRQQRSSCSRSVVHQTLNR